MEIIEIGDVKTEYAFDVAKLLYMALPYFYDLLPVSRDELLSAIVEDFCHSFSETNMGSVFFIEGRVAAVQCSYPSDEMKQRQTESIMGIMRSLPPQCASVYISNLTNYTSEVASVPHDMQGRYLSRITVHPDYRRTGLADKVLEFFMRDGNKLHFLHVARDNLPAIKLYQRHDFKMCPGTELFGVMSKISV